jgi:hypothetical protein
MFFIIQVVLHKVSFHVSTAKGLMACNANPILAFVIAIDAWFCADALAK